MKEKLELIKTEGLKEISAAGSQSELEGIELVYFGRKQGKLTNILKSLSSLTPDEKRTIGQLANEVKQELEAALKNKAQQMATKTEFTDLTAVSRVPSGHLHPITQIRLDIEKVFRSMGFAVVDMPQIDSDYYNFEALNIHPEHPARDMMDTFFLKDNLGTKTKLLMRTHISTIQSHLLEKYKQPFAAVTFGRVFRREATDARHEHTYDSCEGFMVSENLSLANLKFTLHDLFTQLFGNKVEMKFRASYFPFTEPSLEIIMSCIFCNKKGCSVCHTGWLEMGGAGMIHPKVLEYAGFPKNKYSGFAFGLGISRVAMLKYNISDIRLFYQNDQRMLDQF